MYILTQHGQWDLVLVSDIHITDGATADTGDTLVTLGDILDTGDLDGATLDTGDQVITETTLITTEDEVLQHTMEAEETIAQIEILPLEETTLQIEIILTEASTTEAIATETIQQIETIPTEQTAILTIEELLQQTAAETTQPAQRSQTEEAQHKDKVTAMIIQTEDQALQLIEATITPIVAHLELTLLAHRVQ